MTTSQTHTVCFKCGRAEPVEFFGQHTCEPQPRERSVMCWTHRVATWHPSGRCVLCDLEDQT